jgi:hypothetical protein
MNKSLKGAVFSGLIFPGLGQVVLKHYKRGSLIMLTVLVSLAVIVVKTAQLALAILEKIEMEGGTININTISDTVTQVSTTSEDLTLNFFLFLIIACWIIGTVDAYRIGRKKDIEERTVKQALNGNNS